MLSEVNRICEVFDGLRERGRAAVMPFLTAGDPDLETTAALLPAIERAGASVCEIGIPFSDPIADGPVIQASMTRALDRGVRPGEVLDAVADLRAKVDLGLIAMVSYSIVYRRGWTQFLKAAKAAGIDGFIFPDLPVEESSDVIKAVADLDMVCSMLVSPTTPLDRAERIAKASSGFVYVLARSGLTGEQDSLPPGLNERIRCLRGVTDLPMAVGFGIANADQVRQVAQVADAVIVGSAIMRRITTHTNQPRANLVEDVERFVADLCGGLDPLPTEASTD